MKVIESKEATTIVHEILFHKCRDKKEVQNAFAGVLPDNIHMYQRVVDMETFVPSYWVIVTKTPTQSLAQGLKYQVSINQLIDAGILFDGGKG